MSKEENMKRLLGVLCEEIECLEGAWGNPRTMDTILSMILMTKDEARKALKAR